jgi:hypothetical protein
LEIDNIVNGIKTFVLSRLDYVIMNNVMSMVELEKIDNLVIMKLMSTETDPHSQMISSFAFGNIVDDELTE